jgi:hypothetical protein
MRGTGLLGFIVAIAVIGGAEASPCTPPPGFVSSEPPRPASVSDLDAHSEDIDIARPFPEVMRVINGMSLARAIKSPSSLPSVSGNYVLTKGEFGPVGSRQLDCLTDGSTLVEQVLVREQSPRFYHFRYEVWNYTSEQARPIDYAIGEFHFRATGPSSTHIHWSYSFALRRDRFPGYLGPIGDFLFHISFLDGRYADMMRGTLKGYKTEAEAR